MAQEQYSVQLRDYESMSKRHQELHDHNNKLEIACNRATEDLATVNSQLELMRNECANLRAEKKIWEVSSIFSSFCRQRLIVTQSVQSRLIDENKALSVDRSRLSDLVANVQKLHNDVDRSNENDRRRFETQIQALETQT